MSKQTLSSNEARAALLRGVDAVANPVKVTLGPRGRNVMLDRPGQPIATRDGVTVAKEVSNLPDPYENMGAAYAREVADAAVVESGDGTTTASVLLQAIVKRGIELVDGGAEPLLLADGINLAARACVESLKAAAIPATPELVERVAVISTHGDEELGKLIAATTLKVGDGVVELAESRNHETTVEHLDGFYFERGWRPNGEVFVNEHGGEGSGQRCVLENPYILLSERVIVGGKPNMAGDHIFNVLQACVSARRPLLVIAEDLTGDAFNLFAAQVAAGTIPGGCFVKLPGFGETRTAALKDLKIAIGAKRIHTQASTRVDDQLSSFTLEDLGVCKQAIISPTRTVLVEGLANKMELEHRLRQLKRQSEDATNPFEKEQLDHRIARLSGGVAVLRVAFFDPIHLFEDDGSLKRMCDIDPDTRAVIAGLEVMELFEGDGEQKHAYGLLKKVKLGERFLPTKTQEIPMRLYHLATVAAALLSGSLVAHATTLTLGSYGTGDVPAGISNSAMVYAGTPSTTYDIPADSPWAGPLADSSWISFNPNSYPGGSYTAPDGIYTYTTTFTDTTANTSSGTLTVLADDTTDVLLNGILIAPASGSGAGTNCTATQPNCTDPVTYTLSSSDFLDGTNTLTFGVDQEFGYATGLDFDATVDTTAVTPEPSSFILLGTGLLGIAGVMRRRFV